MIGIDVHKFLYEEFDALEKLFDVFRKEPGRILNYSEMAEELKVDRHTIAGMITALVGLDIFKFVRKRSKNKLVRINEEINFRVVVERVKQLMGIYESVELSYDEWRRAMDFLIPLVLAPDQIQRYIKSFDGGTGEFHRTFDEDYIAGRFGSTLPRGVRTPLTELFKKVSYSKLNSFSRSFWEAYLR